MVIMRLFHNIVTMLLIQPKSFNNVCLIDMPTYIKHVTQPPTTFTTVVSWEESYLVVEVHILINVFHMLATFLLSIQTQQVITVPSLPFRPFLVKM